MGMALSRGISLGDVAWDYLRFPATSINPPGATGDPDFDTTDIGFLFDANTVETIYMIAQLPHSYIEGSELRPHIHWEPTSTGTGDVVWRLSYRWRNNGEAAGSFTTISLVTAADGNADTLNIDSFSALTKTDAHISSMLDMKLERFATATTDTYAADARLKEFDLHFQLNDLGSSQEYIK